MRRDLVGIRHGGSVACGTKAGGQCAVVAERWNGGVQRDTGLLRRRGVVERGQAGEHGQHGICQYDSTGVRHGYYEVLGRGGGGRQCVREDEVGVRFVSAMPGGARHGGEHAADAERRGSRGKRDWCILGRQWSRECVDGAEPRLYGICECHCLWGIDGAVSAEWASANARYRV